ncbi:hypothetical protein DFH28DRAFT_1128874 [Melampsora americana]|nr:hypothetical protein DFH28DRAFT_1128874 [Melampsora americana]
MDEPNEKDHLKINETHSNPSTSINSSTSTLTNLDSTHPTSIHSIQQTHSIQSQQISNPLDQELHEIKKTLGDVSASLGGWWGKVSKQSVEALNVSSIGVQIKNVRKDLASLNLIEKAKKEVEKIGEQAKESYAAVQIELEQAQNDLDDHHQTQRIVNVDGLELMITHHPTKEEEEEDHQDLDSKGKEKEIDQVKEEGKGMEEIQDQDPTLIKSTPILSTHLFDSTSISSFFSKLSKDSERITSTFHSTLSQLPNPSSIQLSKSNQASHFDLSEVQRLAEGYLNKGESYLQDVGKELREMVKEAVKVIPPSEDDHHPNHQISEDPAKEVGIIRSNLDTKREASISKLRRDESILLIDPSIESSVNFNGFLNSIDQAGGIKGEAWNKKIQEQLNLEFNPDSEHLKLIFDKIVPTLVSEDVFWSRYFFRLDQIDQEEAARRLVLGAAQEDHEGDFSWDMEEDESENEEKEMKSEDQENRSMTPKLSQPMKSKMNEEKEENQTPSTTDPVLLPQGQGSGGGSQPKTNLGSGRNSSEGTTESFDLISSNLSQPSGEDETLMIKKKDEKDEKEKEKEKEKREEEEEEDSDWE